MAKYRTNLPQLNGDIFLTDGGLETTLIFHYGIELPEFAAFDLLKNDQGCEKLYQYFSSYAAIAREHKVGMILESATWRASSGWGEKLGYSKDALADINHKAIKSLKDIRSEYENEETKVVIGGCVGPKGDGYQPDEMLTEEEFENYHAVQIETFSETDADFISALTMTTAKEAVGLTCAARSAGMPVVISFTVETDGRLPSGLPLKEAIEKVDATTDNSPVYYMVNCAHTTHFADVLTPGEPWVERIRGIRANASSKSHAELDEAEVLDDGNPKEFGCQYKELTDRLHHLNVLGGCCGTDNRHIEEICKMCSPGS